MTLTITVQVPDFWQVVSWATSTLLTVGNLILNLQVNETFDRLMGCSFIREVAERYK